MRSLPGFQKRLQTLIALRDKYLVSRSAASIARSLGKLSRRWLDPRDPYRRKAVRRLVSRSGYAAEAAGALLDALFGALGERGIWKLLRSEFRDPRVLDAFAGDGTGSAVRARGPRLVTHIFAANVPNPAVVSFVLGLLVKSANVGKVSSRDPGILDIYLESLKAADPALAVPNALLSGNDRAALREALAASDLVVVYGNDATVRRFRRMTPERAAFVGYGHRLSLAIVTRSALRAGRLGELCRKVAEDVWMMHQRGCLSPLVVFAEGEAGGVPRQLAEGIAEILRGKPHPPLTGRLCGETVLVLGRFERAQAVHRLRQDEARFWSSETPGHWAVGYEGLHERCRSGLVVWGSPILAVRAFRRLENVLRSLESFGPYLQAAAVEASEKERPAIAERLSALGANRVCRAGRMQMPPLSWHHDGKLNLASWVRWTDLEKE